MSEVAPSTDATAAKQVTQDATVEAKTFTWVTPSIWPDNKVLDILADPKEAEKLEKMSSKEIK
ncbi:hypothetical protein SARC_15936 [Sphaeroforma arctica JP610]|uniref:Uncharacterized protein n=1 Tax=Sphaeroforma arctica JP610 TaxID=667725 RepID=A0A0L0F4A8_9EUKA|nr:hypothetical protein SARC_15936 [Sphaeroforma arctica JP610]KNC71522.1 hypothetical protein SARC_15936 [Sphaeroforma arctica JP610]|eukprot:XP_014145424.1 hypothetical protein SARC_15936 [Sphaeroforma arctica JP610]